MRGSRILCLSLLAALLACSPERPSAEEARREAPLEKAAEQAAEKKEPIQRNFDPQGRLLPSDEYIAGIRLPRGAELSHQDGVLHVYRIRAPIDKVLAYIGPMMITGSVERRGKGAVYRRASVRGAEISPTKVDVSILEVGNSLTRIAVTELPPPQRHIPSADQTKATARDNWRTLD